jgi:hypothetical protein
LQARIADRAVLEDRCALLMKGGGEDREALPPQEDK